MPEIIFWVVVIIMALAGTIYLWNLMTMPAHAESDKCSSACTNPDRTQYDSWGNALDAAGHLLLAAPCTVDPITGQPNPYSCTVLPNERIVPVNPNFGGK